MNLRGLVTNYDAYMEHVVRDTYYTKRASKSDIQRWASAQEAFSSLREVRQAIISKSKHQILSDATTDSCAM